MTLLKVPSAIAEYTVGTMIVLFHLSVVRPLSERARYRNERALKAQQPSVVTQRS